LTPIGSVTREPADASSIGGNSIGHKVGKGGNKGPQSSNQRGGSSRAVSARTKPAESDDGWEMGDAAPVRKNNSSALVETRQQKPGSVRGNQIPEKGCPGCYCATCMCVD